jgi:Cu/Zn superoxide dismutase
VHARIDPQNSSGVSGSATLTVSESGDLIVDIHTEGLIPGPHAQHIHGSAEGGHFTCASMSADANNDAC